MFPKMKYFELNSTFILEYFILTVTACFHCTTKAQITVKILVDLYLNIGLILTFSTKLKSQTYQWSLIGMTLCNF